MSPGDVDATGGSAGAVVPKTETANETFRVVGNDVYGQRRGLTVDVACRTSSKDFDPAQFQHDLVRGMKLKHKDAFQGRSALEVANAQGASYLIETDDGTVFNNVLVDGRHIVIIKVMGPSTEIAEPFNDALFEGRVGWTG